jgi:hypothetical protein
MMECYIQNYQISRHCLSPRTEHNTLETGSLSEIYLVHYMMKKVIVNSHINLFMVYLMMGARGSIVVKALCCKPEGHGFKSR